MNEPKTYGTPFKLHAARHEAGHAVIAASCGHSPLSVCVYRRNGLWNGNCEFTEAGRANVSGSQGVPQTMNGIIHFSQNNDFEWYLNQAEWSIAGLLAHTKTIAEESRPGEEIEFDIGASIAGLIHLILSEVDDTIGKDCNLQFMQPTKGSPFPVTASSGWYSQSDAKVFNTGVTLQQYLGVAKDEAASEIIKDAVKKLDDDATWKTVKRVASELLQSPVIGNDERHLLTGTQLSDLLRPVTQKT